MGLHLFTTSWCVHAFLLSSVWPFVIPWTITRHAPLSVGFCRQEYWSGLPFPPPWIFPIQGSNPCLLHLPHRLHWQVDSLPLSHPGKWEGRKGWVLIPALAYSPTSFTEALHSLPDSSGAGLKSPRQALAPGGGNLGTIQVQGVESVLLAGQGGAYTTSQPSFHVWSIAYKLLPLISIYHDQAVIISMC